MGEKTLMILRGPWSAIAEYWLAPACEQLDDVREQVKRGDAMLFLIYCESDDCGAAVLRLEHFETHDEGVIVAAGGRLAGVSLLRELLPVFEQKFPSAQRIRIHTRRRGMVQQLARAGYEFQEFVLSKRAPPIPQQCQQQQGGGKGSSSTSSTSTANIDKRLVVDAGTGVSADQSSVVVNTLDAGAVAGALGFGAQALESARSLGASSLAYGTDVAGKTAKYAIDLSGMSIDRVFGVADKIFTGAFGQLDKNAELIERAGGFVEKAYADAKGSGAERYYLAVGVVAAVVIVAVNAQRK